MSLSVPIIVDRNTLGPAVRERAARMDNARLARIAARAVGLKVREYVAALNLSRANALGGQRTNFYQKAGQSVTVQMEGEAGIVAITLLGFRQRYYGGRIVPRYGAKFLAIPVAPEAHGRRPREFRDLELVAWRKGGELRFGLARKVTAKARKFYRAAGKPVRGKLLYRLKTSVIQEADPTVLPPRAALAATASGAVQTFILDLNAQEAAP